MRVLHVGIFADHCLGGDVVLKSGFVNNGHAVDQFDYRELARELGIERMNRRLASIARSYDLVFIGKGELLQHTTLAQIHGNNTHVALWYGDLRPRPEPWLLALLPHCDTFFMTSAGETLKLHFLMGRPGRAAFFLNPCDPSIAGRFSHVPRSVEPPLFTATAQGIVGPERDDVYRYLCHRGDVQIVGSPKRYIRNRLARRVYGRLMRVSPIRGREYIERIIRSRFGIGVSAFQQVKYYTSDRLMHYLSLGKLFLAHRFPGCDALFRDGKDVVFYDDISDLESKMRRFAGDQESAELIGAAAQLRVSTEYNAQAMVRMMVEVMESGATRTYEWAEVLS